MNGYLIFIVAASVVFLILFIIFVVLYNQAKGKTKALNDAYLDCRKRLGDGQVSLDKSDQTLRDCTSAQDQLTATLDENFIVDTSNMDNPIFIRDSTEAECNYPILTLRWAHTLTKGEYQTCNFNEFVNNSKDFTLARCSNRGPSKGNGKCSNSVGSFTKVKNITPFNEDPYIFGGYTATTKCVYWKIVNKFPPSTYNVVFKYRTDSNIEETIYEGTDAKVDSTTTVSVYGGDSCIPISILCKIEVNGVSGGSDPTNADIFTFPAPGKDFVVTLWYNTQLSRPTCTLSYLISD